MKLVSIKAENYLRLLAVEIAPDGSLVQISGPNGAGKSAVLSALECALSGKDAVPADPVRHGADEALIEVNLGELVVRRRILPDRKTVLEVTNAEGFTAKSPQKMLEGLFGKLLDPVAFTRLTPKEQRELLADMVGLSTMLDDLWRADEADRERRKDVNRELKALLARLDAMPEVMAVDPIDVSATFAELRAARDHNNAVGRAQQDRAAREQKVATCRAEAVRLRDEATRLLDRADAVDGEANVIADELKNAPAIAELMDTDAIEARIAAADAINSQRRAYDERAKLVAEADELDVVSKDYTASLEQREAERRAVIEAANLPIPGLGFGEDCITYNGVRFDQASTAEQLRVSASIAMAMSPKLRVMIVREGSLLDENSLRMLAEMAEAQDFVVLCETVDTSGKVGIYIEDGSVAAINGEPVGVAVP